MNEKEYDDLIYVCSFISDAISMFNSDLYYQNPNYIKESYLAGELLA